MRDIINIAMGELTATFDNEVVKAVQKVGIDVDKEELLKALELHRSLVRCGECKYWKSTVQMPNGTEVKCLYGRKPDDFCSYGSRSEKPNNSND